MCMYIYIYTHTYIHIYTHTYSTASHGCASAGSSSTPDGFQNIPCFDDVRQTP